MLPLRAHLAFEGSSCVTVCWRAYLRAILPSKVAAITVKYTPLRFAFEWGSLSNDHLNFRPDCSTPACNSNKSGQYFTAFPLASQLCAFRADREHLFEASGN